MALTADDRHPATVNTAAASAAVAAAQNRALSFVLAETLIMLSNERADRNRRAFIFCPEATKTLLLLVESFLQRS